MRANVKIDGATTNEVRAFAAACARAGIDRPRVGCEGPEKWGASITLDTDLPSAVPPLVALQALASAYAADGASEENLPSGNCAPVYLPLRPKAAALTRDVLLTMTREIDDAARAIAKIVEAVDDDGDGITEPVRTLLDKIAWKTEMARDCAANLPEVEK